MPAARPQSGFQGYRHPSAQLLPGVEVQDYLAADEPALHVPTTALSSDLKRISVRTSFMEGKAEQQRDGAKRYSVCSADGSNGWSPFMPNRYATAVLEPLQQRLGDDAMDFEAFWDKHMRVPLPEVLRVAHGSVFSARRHEIHRRPRTFYQGLLADVTGEQKRHQALFVEPMWWYMLNEEGAQMCPQDLPTGFQARRSLSLSASDADTPSNRRQLVAPVAVLNPKVGDDVKFGQVVKVEWSSIYAVSQIAFRVELWKFGNFQTRLSDAIYGTSLEWFVEPDSAHDYYYKNGFVNSSLTNAGNGTRTKFSLQPGDHYTIRVCDWSIDANQPYAERICDDSFAESGEFDIVPTILVDNPACAVSYSPPQLITVTWTSFYVHNTTLTVSLFTDDYYLVYEEKVPDYGYYSFYVTPDTPGGSYRFRVSASCETSEGCDNYWMLGDFRGHKSGTTSASTEAWSCAFNVIAVPHPPPPPASPPPPPKPPGLPWEVPILKAFEGAFGSSGMHIAQGANYDYSAASTVYGGDNCQIICRPAQMASQYGRRLLFGGLQYASTGIICSPQMHQCNCAGC